jgi:hypothetical protein
MSNSCSVNAYNGSFAVGILLARCSCKNEAGK